MYRYVSLLVLAAAFVYIFLLLRKNRISLREIGEMLSGGWAEGLAAGRPDRGGVLFLRIRVISYYVSLLLFLVLFLTGMFPAVIAGVRMTGLLLMIHVESALLFSISFTVALVFWAHRHQFTDADIRRNAPAAELSLKLLFWLLTLLTIIAMLSILLMLFPIFGSDGMENLADIHRYSVLLLSVAVVFHSYYVILHNRQIPKQ